MIHYIFFIIATIQNIKNINESKFHEAKFFGKNEKIIIIAT